MCDFCDKGKVLLEKEVISSCSWGFSEEPIPISDTFNDKLICFIDKRREKAYLRLTDEDDNQCIESGVKVEIAYCPKCGKKIGS